MDGFWDQFIYYTTTVWDYARHVVDIVIVAYIFYWIYRFFTDTRAVQLIKGLLIIGIVAIVAGLLRLDALDWLVKNLTASLVITVIILFQPELIVNFFIFRRKTVKYLYARFMHLLQNSG